MARNLTTHTHTHTTLRCTGAPTSRNSLATCMPRRPLWPWLLGAPCCRWSCSGSSAWASPPHVGYVRTSWDGWVAHDVGTGRPTHATHLQARSDTLNSGFFALVFSAVCLVLSMVAWMVRPVVVFLSPSFVLCSLPSSKNITQGVPLSAFTTECRPSPFTQWNGTAIGLPSPPQDGGHQGVVCIQLDGGLCLDNCATTNTVIRMGGMFGLVLFSALAQFVCVLFWVHFHDELLTAHDHVRGRRGSTVEGGAILAGPLLHPALVGPPCS